MCEAENGGGSNGRGNDPAVREKVSPLEWIVAALGALLVLGAAGFLLRDALGTDPAPPRIAIEVDSVVRSGEGYLVEFRVRNRGSTTAAGLLVEGEIRDGAGALETSEVTFDFVPAEGVRRAGLFFTRDPGRHRLEIRPKGYDRP